MTDEKKIIQEQETQHLKGGQESPDMVAFRERFYTDKAWLNRDAINAIGAIAGNMLLLFDTFTEAQETLNEIKATLKSIDEKATAITNELSRMADDLEAEESSVESIASEIADVVSHEKGFSPALRIEGDRIYNTPCTY